MTIIVTSTTPLVSVLMTTYNRAKYIAEAIESVIASSYGNWELIIVDDKSQDKSVEIALKYAVIDPRIRVIVNEANLGDYPNRNKAASYAKGKYLKYLDADDTIYKFSLEYMVVAMETNPDAALGLSFNKVDDSKPYPHKSEPVETIKAEFLGESILGCGPSAAIIRHDIFNQLDGFSGKQYIGDHEFWLIIAQKYPIIKLQPSLVWWRIHDEQQIAGERKNIEIKNVRFQHSLHTLNICKEYFNENEFELAKKRLNQNYSRNLLRTLFLNRNIGEFITLYRMSNLSFIQLIGGFKGYI